MTLPRPISVSTSGPGLMLRFGPLESVLTSLAIEVLRGGGFKFLLLDRLSKALAQLFLVCEHIF